MAPSHRSSLSFRPSLCFVLLAVLLGALCLAGGASRATVLGQGVVGGVSWLLLMIAILFGPRPSLGGGRPVLSLLVMAAALAFVQLVPLPPAIWQLLPGRSALASALAESGQGELWRPWSIVPGATLDAAASLVVPFVTLILVLSLKEDERRLLPALILTLIVVFTFVGLIQFSGAGIRNPFINDASGDVSGMFANRNHFALLLALGCLLAPVWGFLGESDARWRAPVAWGLVPLFLLMILASGSRAGLVMGLLALVLSVVLSRRAMSKALARYPRWAFPALIAAILGTAAIFVLLSVMADRALSIDRLFAIDQSLDMRARGLPVVLEMIRHYFPFGTGLGSFDPMFRLHEPLKLLKPTYFNHAHNDFLEVALDAGLAGVLLLLAALGWWAWASIRAWQQGSGRHHALAQLGSAMLFLVILASIVDYPARTPMIMAIVVVAAVWLSGHSQARDVSPLPGSV